MKKMTFSIFSKILLLLLLIFIGLAFYAYTLFEKEKEAITNKKITVKVNTPLYHPPLSDKKETKENQETLVINEEQNNSKDTNESNQTLATLEGAEYISPEELERRNLEENVSEEFLQDEQVIPQNELKNYPLAETLDLPQQEEITQEEITQEEITQEEIIAEEENILPEELTPPTMQSSTNPFLGERIDTNPQQPQIHPSLGRPIGNHESSPF